MNNFRAFISVKTSFKVLTDSPLRPQNPKAAPILLLGFNPFIYVIKPAIVSTILLFNVGEPKSFST